MNDEIMTISDIAAYLKITEKTAYRLVAEGKIPGFKVGGSWRFNRMEIQAWAKANQQAAQPQGNTDGNEGDR